MLFKTPPAASYGQAPYGAQTPEQRDQWAETTDMNRHLRQALKMQGLRVLHISETGTETGTADLLVYDMQRRLTGVVDREFTDLQVIRGWLELKIENDVNSIRPAQREFMRDHWREGRNAIFVMRDRRMDMFALRQGDLKGRVTMVPSDPYDVNWSAIFERFRARK